MFFFYIFTTKIPYSAKPDEVRGYLHKLIKLCLPVISKLPGSINKYPYLKTGGVAEGSCHYRRVLPSGTRHC